ncbi:hypothetical protein [Calothrix sp. NIES-2098]|uniref:hypothetical protein n=1 Tax=Calothrix sp. NIES-2098 TaxID=1954171 RepID=UPI000B6009D9|nr:transposase [Calothrix sp. NIES-2098]
MIFDSNENEKQDQENIEIGIFQLDIELVEPNNNRLARPYITTITDPYSRCIMGSYLSSKAPNSKVITLALRHAILPKQYEEE